MQGTTDVSGCRTCLVRARVLTHKRMRRAAAAPDALASSKLASSKFASSKLASGKLAGMSGHPEDNDISFDALMEQYKQYEAAAPPTTCPPPAVSDTPRGVRGAYPTCPECVGHAARRALSVSAPAAQAHVDGEDDEAEVGASRPGTSKGGAGAQDAARFAAGGMQRRAEVEAIMRRRELLMSQHGGGIARGEEGEDLQRGGGGGVQRVTLMTDDANFRGEPREARTPFPGDPSRPATSVSARGRAPPASFIPHEGRKAVTKDLPWRISRLSRRNAAPSGTPGPRRGGRPHTAARARKRVAAAAAQRLRSSSADCASPSPRLTGRRMQVRWGLDTASSWGGTGAGTVPGTAADGRPETGRSEANYARVMASLLPAGDARYFEAENLFDCSKNKLNSIPIAAYGPANRERNLRRCVPGPRVDALLLLPPLTAWRGSPGILRSTATGRTSRFSGRSTTALRGSQSRSAR